MSKAGNLLEKANKSLEQKLYSKASIEFSMAIEQEPEKIGALLTKRFEEAAFDYQYDHAISLGMAILNHKPEQYKLANRLGNYARKIGNIDQSIGLYKHAINMNPGYKYPLYNIAATLSRLEYFDNEAVNAVNKFPQEKIFYFPDYFYIDGDGDCLNCPEYETKIEQSILKFKKFRERENLDSTPEPDKAVYMQELIRTMNFDISKIENVDDDDDDKTEEVAEEFFLLDLDENDIEGSEGNETIEPAGESHKQRQFSNQNTAASELAEVDYIEFFERLVLVDPKNQDLHLYNELIFCLNHGKNKLAESLMRRIKRDSNKFYPLKYLKMLEAYFHILRKDFTEAESVMSTLLGRDPSNRYYTINLGLVYRHFKQSIKSFRYLIKADHMLNASERHVEMLEYVRVVNRRFLDGQKAVAKTQMEKLVKEKLPFASIYFNLATIYLQEKKYLPAAETFRIAGKLEPKYSELVQTQVNKIYQQTVQEGELLFKANKIRAAFEMFLDGYKIDRNIVIIRKLCEVMDSMDLDHGEMKLRMELRGELLKMEKSDEKNSMSRKQKERTEEVDRNYRNLCQLAELNYKQKKYYNAMEFYESAFRIKPDKEIFVRLANLYKAMKKNEKLVSLANKYKVFLDHEQKMKKFEESSTIKV